MEDYFSFSPKKVNKLVCRDSVPYLSVTTSYVVTT